MPYKDKEDKKKNSRKYYIKNRDKLREYRENHSWKTKEYYAKNKEKILEKAKQNRENKKEYDNQYYKNNQEKINERTKKWRKNNIERQRENDKQYYIKNRERLLEISNQWYKNNRKKKNQNINLKRKTDLKSNINSRISSGIRTALRSNKKGRKWEKLIGYTLSDLIKHLKKTIPFGYSWQECHIDHVIPISAFNFNKPEHPDFLNCWALSNLRLLPAKENLIKNAKLTKTFQPALKILIKEINQ